MAAPGFVQAAVDRANAEPCWQNRMVGWIAGLNKINQVKTFIASRLASYLVCHARCGRRTAILLPQTPVSNYYLYGEFEFPGLEETPPCGYSSAPGLSPDELEEWYAPLPPK